MPELRRTWRMAAWWHCAILIVIAAFFGWVISQGLKSTSPDVWGHVIIVPYGVLLYVTAAAIVNRHTVVATRDHVIRTNGPISLGGNLRVLQQKVECAFFTAITGVTDDGDTFVVGYMVGVQTRAGRDVALFGPLASEDAATDLATRVAEGLSTPNRPIEVRAIGDMKEDPGERRLAWTWAAIVASAFIAGIAWELIYRARR